MVLQAIYHFIISYSNSLELIKSQQSLVLFSYSLPEKIFVLTKKKIFPLTKNSTKYQEEHLKINKLKKKLGMILPLLAC